MWYQLFDWLRQTDTVALNLIDSFETDNDEYDEYDEDITIWQK